MPETVEELPVIALALGADPEASVFTGPRASEAVLAGLDLSGVETLAFATHSLAANDLDGLYEPALALSAPKEGEGDGLLSMGEILELRLSADLVILSACNTAAGDGRGAEAVSGLGRAFFYAGARSLLVSHWPVHSLATRDLMVAMFSALRDAPTLTQQEALQHASMTLAREGAFIDQDGDPRFSYAHPIFWAPFVLIGDGSRTGGSQLSSL